MSSVYNSYCDHSKDVAIYCSTTGSDTNFDYDFDTGSDTGSNVYIPSGSGTVSPAWLVIV